MISKFFQKIFIFFLVFSLSVVDVFANVRISSILPNPTTNVRDEYIEIQNPYCEAISLENYRLTNSKQEYIFGEKILEKHEKLVLTRAETGISLRDAGDVIVLYNAENEKIDEINYNESDTKKWNILTFDIENENCEANNEGENNENPDNEDKNDNEDTKSEGENTENEGQGSDDENNNEQKGEDTDEENFIFPEEWELFDRDGDGFYEEILIIFPEILTGSLDINSFSFIEIDGEKREKIENNVVLSGSILENSITLSVDVFLKNENIWKFENEKFSGFFLVLDESSEIVTLDGGKKIRLDENTFEKYTKITKNSYQDDDKNEEEKSEDIKNPIENTENIFPEINPVLQRSTTAELEDFRLFCDENPCKINLNFDEIFDKNFPKSDFSCEIILDDKKYSTCNPPQMTFSQDTSMIFRLVHTKTQKEKFATFFVDFSLVEDKKEEKSQTEKNNQNQEKISKNKPKAENTEKITKNEEVKNKLPPVIRVDSDGKIEKIYEWADDEKIACFVSKCVINLNASATENPDNLRLKFLWKFANISESNRKNPTSVEFTSGQHEIILIVTDELNRIFEKKISVFVPTEEEIIQEKNVKNSLENENNLPEKSEDFEEVGFEIPEFVLQNPLNFTIENDEKYICYTKTANCSINLSLSEVSKNFSYSWLWNDEESMISQNPRSKSLGIGKNFLTLTIFEKENPENILATKKLVVEVIKTTTKKPKTTKSKVTSSKKSEKNTEKEAKNEESEPLPEEVVDINTEYNSLPLSMAGILFSGVLFARLRQKSPEENMENSQENK